MLRGGCTPLQVERFVGRVERFLHDNGEGLIPESKLNPVEELVGIESLAPEPELLKRTVILKLNGGLGTTMGLRQPKGMLEVRRGEDFYSILLKQTDAFANKYGFRIPLMFMNSFVSTVVTKQRLSGLGFSQELPWEVMQSRVPKIDKQGLPLEVADEYGWCPPGHGDLYATLIDSKIRDLLVKAGYYYLFVSNIDNLGAVLDSRPLAYMHEQGLSFLMEVTLRGASDSKGGHLAFDERSRLILRELSQCPQDELRYFQDIERYRYFNTNNLWIDLRALDESWTDLPSIVNRKPVVPQDTSSLAAIQLETAMGAAIGTVVNTGALAVGRERFLPVKSTNDLFAIRSDLYELDGMGRLKATVKRPTLIDLDPEYYKMMDEFNALVQGVPSLRKCSSLKVRGPVLFSSGDSLIGKVAVANVASKPLPFGQFA